jgi:predicted MFS family arabinose efflux permease
MLRGLGGGVVWVFSTQLLMQLAPNEVRGRIFATEFAFFNLGSAVASALVGAALDANFGVQGIIWSMAAFSVAPPILWIAWMVRRGETLDVTNE